MIQLEHLSKTFPGKDSVHALRDVSLTVRKGEIYGVIGYSGAGKSTLIRCINLLERPDEGTVRVDGVELLAPEGGALRFAADRPHRYESVGTGLCRLSMVIHYPA